MFWTLSCAGSGLLEVISTTGLSKNDRGQKRKRAKERKRDMGCVGVEHAQINPICRKLVLGAVHNRFGSSQHGLISFVIQ